MLEPPEPDGKNGWYLSMPKITYERDSANAEMVRSPGIDEELYLFLREEPEIRWRVEPEALVSGGQIINELCVGIISTLTDAKHPFGGAPFEFFKKIKVDTKDPHTLPRLVPDNPERRFKRPPTIRLVHREFARDWGGLNAEYLRDAEFKELLLRRVDAQIDLSSTDRQSTPQVHGAHSALWTGKLLVKKAGMHTFELDKCFPPGKGTLENRWEKQSLTLIKGSSPGAHGVRFN